MNLFTRNITRFFRNEWVVSTLLLCLFLITNRYIYGWDDQHLEIPLLKQLIDPALYAGDYYVESLKQNFTSYLYPILAKVISVDQIPAVYLTLYLLSRYFMFYFMYKLWWLISKSRMEAFLCVAMFFLIGRTEEFLYRTFSHQEFAFAFIFAGIYFFYKGRFLLSALILGVAANFHALYALFPMFYMSIYYALFLKKEKWETFFTTGFTFVGAALPFLFWAIPNAISKRTSDPSLFEGWIDLYLVACPYNFLFGDYPLTKVFSSLEGGLNAIGPYIFILALFLFNLYLNKKFRHDAKAQSIVIGSFILIALCFIFSYVHPHRFGLDLNLARNNQYLQFLLMGYTTLWVLKQVRKDKHLVSGLLGVALASLIFRNIFASVALIIIAAILGVRRSFLLKDQQKWLHCALWGVSVLTILTVIQIKAPFIYPSWPEVFTRNWFAGLGTGLVIVLMLVCLGLKRANIFSSLWLKRLFVIIPIMAIFVHFCLLHYRYVQITKYGGGFWQLQRNWEDMQYYVKEHTPVESMLLVPYDMEMGGFRIFSERKIVLSYRDCGIVGFDYKATKEWESRKNDVLPFKVIVSNPELAFKAVLVAITKHHIDYVVFMNYMKPPDSIPFFEPVYTNEVYSLYRIKK